MADAGSSTRKPAYYGVRSALRHRAIEKATDIRAVDSRPSTTNGVTYDLSGRRVDGLTLSPGIYIKEGKKFIVGK